MVIINRGQGPVIAGSPAGIGVGEGASGKSQLGSSEMWWIGGDISSQGQVFFIYDHGLLSSYVLLLWIEHFWVEGPFPVVVVAVGGVGGGGGGRRRVAASL